MPSLGVCIDVTHCRFWQIAGRTAVKGQIKLRFRNRAGRPVTCVRSLQASSAQALPFLHATQETKMATQLLQ